MGQKLTYVFRSSTGLYTFIIWSEIQGNRPKYSLYTEGYVKRIHISKRAKNGLKPNNLSLHTAGPAQNQMG
uniref:Uncharacterized protein n=1 Tax=Solanum tuberosum TaxID=4113 RepID=M1D4D9_SOLTU